MMLKSMIEARIRVVDAFSYLIKEVGRIENIIFSKSNASNYIKKERSSIIGNGDTNALVEVFKERQVEVSMFAWNVQLDESNRLINFFG